MGSCMSRHIAQDSWAGQWPCRHSLLPRPIPALQGMCCCCMSGHSPTTSQAPLAAHKRVPLLLAPPAECHARSNAAATFHDQHGSFPCCTSKGQHCPAGSTFEVSCLCTASAQNMTHETQSCLHSRLLLQPCLLLLLARDGQLPWVRQDGCQSAHGSGIFVSYALCESLQSCRFLCAGRLHLPDEAGQVPGQLAGRRPCQGCISTCATLAACSISSTGLLQSASSQGGLPVLKQCLARSCRACRQLAQQLRHGEAGCSCAQLFVPCPCPQPHHLAVQRRCFQSPARIALSLPVC